MCFILLRNSFCYDADNFISSLMALISFLKARSALDMFALLTPSVSASPSPNTAAKLVLFSAAFLFLLVVFYFAFFSAAYSAVAMELRDFSSIPRCACNVDIFYKFTHTYCVTSTLSCKLPNASCYLSRSRN